MFLSVCIISSILVIISSERYTEHYALFVQIRPIQVKAVKDYPSQIVERDHLEYKNHDIIVVVDKK